MSPDQHRDPRTERIPHVPPTVAYPPQYEQQAWPPQQQGHPYAPPPPAKPKRTGRKILAWSAVAVLGLFVVAGIAGNQGAAPDPAASGAAVPVVEGEAPAAAVEPAAPDGIGDGTHIVGTDIEPGTYRTTGAAPGLFELCLWSTKDGPSSNSDIIDLGTANVDEAQVVEIDGSVGAFESQGCAPWTRVG